MVDSIPPQCYPRILNIETARINALLCNYAIFDSEQREESLLLIRVVMSFRG